MVGQALADLLFSQRAFTRATHAQCIYQGEQVIEDRISLGGPGHAGMEWLHGGTLHFAIWGWPDGGWLPIAADFLGQR